MHVAVAADRVDTVAVELVHANAEGVQTLAQLGGERVGQRPYLVAVPQRLDQPLG